MPDLSRQDDLAIITLNRPEVLNALNRATLRALDDILTEIELGDARCIIIAGAGDRAFCAGADISELAGRDAAAELDGTLLGQGVFSRLEALRQPSVALVHGFALGGGCELALACTFRLATARARFGLPEVKLGLAPGYGGTQRLARLIGLPRALEVMMSGRFIEGEEAERIGLVNRLLNDEEDRMGQAAAYARQFTGQSLMAQRLIREAASRGLNMSLSDGLALEAALSSLAFRTVDGQEGVAAFLEKRPPRFSDR